MPNLNRNSSLFWQYVLLAF